MYRKIAVPLDGSTFAECALPLAQRLARRASASLHLVMIAEPAGPTAAQCEEYLAKTRDRIRQDHDGDVTTAVRAGTVAQRLLDETVEVGADATVMATHGRGGLSRMWLGSVATAFLHATTKPLILVRPDADQGDDAVPWGFAKILVPLDGTELSERVLAHATGFGGLFDAAYHLTRVVPPPIEIGSVYIPPPGQVTTELLETAKRAAIDYLEAAAEPLRSRGLRVTTSVPVDPQPGRGILEAAEREGCDSIAMATHGRVGLSRALLGSAADKVLRATQVPILLYRPEAIPGSSP